jgi:ASC-1-like (ASCH) protein
MVHIAIMKKSWDLTQKILSGEKTIETRWYINKIRPWDQIKEGETIYFKDSGEPITVQAEVAKVEQYSDIDEVKRSIIFDKYSSNDLGISGIEGLVKTHAAGKRYAIFIHLINPKEVNPFEIDKIGHGIMSAWLCVDDINSVMKNNG